MKRNSAINKSIASFETLVKKIKETFLAGKERVRQEMIQTYWQSGKYIHEHILHHKDRADYGKQILLKLSARTEVDKRTLHQMLLVYRRFPNIMSRGSQLPWRVLRKLAAIEDKDLREDFTRRAVEGSWTGEQTQQKINVEIRESGKKIAGYSRRDFKAPPLPPLKASAGSLYTYRLLQPEQVHPERPYVLIDLGFETYQRLYRSGLKPGDIIESAWNEKKEDYAIEKSSRGETELFTFKALIEHLADGDTLRVKVDLGFDTWTRQYLRLRGIDCPEIDTDEGKAAKKFVEARLSKTSFVLLKSTRSDKYDRYLADVWIPNESAVPDIYLNQLLVDNHLASRI